jgi:hypothetical protein
MFGIEITHKKVSSMKNSFCVFSIVLIGLLAFSISSCDDQMTSQMDTIVDTVTDSPPEDPVAPPSEPVAPLPDGAVVSIAPGQIVSPAVGAQLTVSVYIAQAVNVAGYDLKVRFDPTALQYVESANADYLPAGTYAPSAEVSANTVHLVAVSFIGAAVESGTLATVTFEVVAAKGSTLQLIDVFISDNAGNLLSVTAQDGTIEAP